MAQPGRGSLAQAGALSRPQHRWLACAVQESGRAVAFASDCGPHWCPSDFLAWAGYATLWQRMVGWAAGRL